MTATVPLRDTFPSEEDGGEPTLPRKRYDHEEEIDRFEVARRLNMAPATVQQWVHRSQAGEMAVPFPEGRKAGGRLLWTWGSVVAWHKARLKAMHAGPRASASPKPERSEPPASVAVMRRELAAVVKRLAAHDADEARLTELCGWLNDAGVSWDDLAELIGAGSGAAVRMRVNRARGNAP